MATNLASVNMNDSLNYKHMSNQKQAIVIDAKNKEIIV